MKMENSSKWFETWFNSRYYHILYNNRDEQDAEFFLDHLIDYLQPKKEDRILDLACGRGRHSVYLNKKGFDVVGVDLSTESIEYASKFGNDKLFFEVHDMRNLLCTNSFQYVLNLFTSFGYFERKWENEKVILNIAKTLVPGGKLILDFLNAELIKQAEYKEDNKIIEGILFKIKKEIKDQFIIKSIDFTDANTNYHFEEKLSLLTQKDFEYFFKKAGLSIEATFGDYSLSPFDIEHSPRLIYCAVKK
jgi:SAM-dependent methyltransferase